MARLAAALLAVLALAAPADAAQRSGSRATLAAPTGIKAFLLRANEQPAHVFSRTPAFAWNPVRGARRYEFVLATSPTFAGNAILWDDTSLQAPASAVPVTLPWITGSPYSLYARVRAIAANGSVGGWSAKYGFNMRWASVPTQVSSGPGFVRWTPVDGATSYDVWFVNLDVGGGVSKVISTITNVADEREYYSFHHDNSWIQRVEWRVRAVRRVQDTKGPANGLPTVTYGPWSQIYASTNPTFTQGKIVLGDATSDATSTPSSPTVHRVMPAFQFSGDQPLDPTACVSLAQRCELFHVYVFSDIDCINMVYKSALIGSPAYAPRITGTLAIPGDTKKLVAAQGKNLADGPEGKTFSADGLKITATESQPSSTFTATLIAQQAAASGSGSSGTGSGSSPGTTPPAAPSIFPASLSGQGPPVDLWDTHWPTGRYYWTVVPVQYYVDVQPDADPSAPPPANPPIVYYDQDVPQDACAAGRIASFGKVGEPVVTASGTPYASGLSTKGGLLAASAKRPVFAAPPLVAWQPALGATAYEMQWSKKAYPWRPEGNLFTFSTSANLSLKPGNWYYRVRGIDLSLPGSAQMTWSEKMGLVIAKPKFKIG
jgi:hypothetical protein